MLSVRSSGSPDDCVLLLLLLLQTPHWRGKLLLLLERSRSEGLWGGQGRGWLGTAYRGLGAVG